MECKETSPDKSATHRSPSSLLQGAEETPSRGPRTMVDQEKEQEKAKSSCQSILLDSTKLVRNIGAVQRTKLQQSSRHMYVDPRLRSLEFKAHFQRALRYFHWRLARSTASQSTASTYETFTVLSTGSLPRPEWQGASP